MQYIIYYIQYALYNKQNTMESNVGTQSIDTIAVILLYQIQTAKGMLWLFGSA